jgi:hypothetical protein
MCVGEEGYDEIILLSEYVIKRSPLSLTTSLLFGLNALQKQNVPPVHRTSLSSLVLNTQCVSQPFHTETPT